MTISAKQEPKYQFDEYMKFLFAYLETVDKVLERSIEFLKDVFFYGKSGRKVRQYRSKPHLCLSKNGLALRSHRISFQLQLNGK
jgi:hypothetical protein